MVKRSIQGYVELASGLGEMTRGAARDAAAELVALTNADLSPKKVTKQASRLADDLIAAANTNRRNLVSLVRAEVDKAVGRLDVSAIQQELANVADTVQTLRGQVEELAGGLSGRPAPSASGPGGGMVEVAHTATGPLTDGVSDTVGASVSGAAARTEATKRRPARASLRKSASTGSATSTSSPKKASATKAPAKKASTTKKASAAKASTTKKDSAPAAGAAKKSAAKKSTAKKSTAKNAPAKKAGATTQASTKKAAARTTSARTTSADGA
jgi:hypothetical protein